MEKHANMRFNWQQPVQIANTSLLTPCSRVLLENLTGFQLVKKFPAFYGTQRFIKTFTSAQHISPSSASFIQFIPPHSTFWRSNLILFSHLRLVLPSGLPSGFTTKTLYMPLLSPKHATCTYTSFFLILSPKQYLVRRTHHSAPHYVVFSTPLLPRSSEAQIFSSSPYSQNPQPTFLPQCERPSFTPTQNNRQNYSSLYLNISIFG